MDPAEAARVLGVGPDTPWPEVRRAYRRHIRRHHPDRAGGATGMPADDRAVLIIEAFRVLDAARLAGSRPPTPPPSGRATGDPRDPANRRASASNRRRIDAEDPADQGGSGDGGGRSAIGAPGVVRVDGDTLRLDAPADEAFRWLVEAAHDVGEITYLDRSGPILEILGTFEGEPATSLLVTLQGRLDGTDALCSAESIEARPGPPTAAVVDLLELALRRRQAQPDGDPRSNDRPGR